MCVNPQQCSEALARCSCSLWRCVQLSYRSALESLDPAISARCNWSAIQDTVPKDRAYDHLDNARRESIFEDVKADAAAAEAQAQAAAAAEAALLRARHEQREKQEREQLERVKAGATASSNGSRSNQDAERQVLSKLRADQVCCLSCDLYLASPVLPLLAKLSRTAFLQEAEGCRTGGGTHLSYSTHAYVPSLPLDVMCSFGETV